MPSRTYRRIAGFPPVFREQARVSTMTARVTVAEIGGQLPEAEAAVRRALRQYETEILPNEAMAAQMGGLPLGTFSAAADRSRADLARILLRQGRLAEAEPSSVGASSQLTRRGHYAAEVGNMVLAWPPSSMNKGAMPRRCSSGNRRSIFYDKIGTEPASSTMSGGTTAYRRGAGRPGQMAGRLEHL